MPEQRSASPDLESLRPVLAVMTEIQARYIADLRESGGPASGGVPGRLALALERGAEAVASDPAQPALAARRAIAFGAALWAALTAMPDHSLNERKRLLHAAYAAHARLEAGEDGSGLAAALQSTGGAVALAGAGAAGHGTASLADHLVAALGAVTASAAALDPSLTET